MMYHRLSEPLRVVLLAVVAVGTVMTNEVSFWSDLNLHEDHIPYYFNSNPELGEKCEKDAECPYKVK